jgi:hypothetical protein
MLLRHILQEGDAFGRSGKLEVTEGERNINVMIVDKRLMKIRYLVYICFQESEV